MFDAVAVLVSAEGAALLAKDAAAKDFVSDAFAHCKFIAIGAQAKPIFESAGIADDLDEACMPLAKPADADDVTDALLAPSDSKAPPPENPMSADRVRWEHIQRVYELCNRNVSETARRLNMHRRTLQRILAKRAPK